MDVFFDANVVKAINPGTQGKGVQLYQHKQSLQVRGPAVATPPARRERSSR